MLQENRDIFIQRLGKHPIRKPELRKRGPRLDTSVVSGGVVKGEMEREKEVDAQRRDWVSVLYKHDPASFADAHCVVACQNWGMELILSHILGAGLSPVPETILIDSPNLDQLLSRTWARQLK